MAYTFCLITYKLSVTDLLKELKENREGTEGLN